MLPIALPDDYIEHGSVDALKQEPASTRNRCSSRLPPGIFREETVWRKQSNERTPGCSDGKTGACASREKAKALIMAGEVLVGGQREDKAGTLIDEKAGIEVKGSSLRYVSREG